MVFFAPVAAMNIAPSGGNTISGHPNMGNNIVSFWDLNGNGTDAHGSNDLTLTGGSFTTGLLGQAASLDGVNDTLSSSYAGIGGSSARSFACWFKTANASDVSLCDYGSTTSGGRNGMGIDFFGVPAFVVVNGRTTGSSTVDDDSWHSIVFSFSGTQVQDCKIYVDGVEETYTYSSGTTAINTGSSWNLGLGYSGNFGQYLGGLIQSAGFWSYALSAADAADFHNGGTPLRYA